MHDHLSTSSSDHARVGERVREPLGAVMCTKVQDELFGKNRLVGQLRDFFPQLTHRYPSGDASILILADHARLGELLESSVHEHRQTRLDEGKIRIASSCGIPGCVSWRKIFVIFGARSH